MNDEVYVYLLWERFGSGWSDIFLHGVYANRADAEEDARRMGGQRLDGQRNTVGMFVTAIEITDQPVV